MLFSCYGRPVARRWLSNAVARTRWNSHTNIHPLRCTFSRCMAATGGPPLDDKNGNEKKMASSTPLPGVLLASGTAVGGFGLASVLSDSVSIPLSGIPVSILLGMGIHNTIGVSEHFQPGLKYATKMILQVGIVCVAAKLSVPALVSLGTNGLPVVLASIGSGFLFIPAAGRLMQLPPKMSLLMTAGTTICGVTAISALAPAIKASNRDTAVAIANTVVFGTIGMLSYPFLLHSLGVSSEQVGMCLGVGIHDTSQVLGAALAYKESYGDEVAFQTAAVTKLMRNLGLVLAIPALTLVSNRSESNSDSTIDTSNLSQYVPGFLIAFIGMTAARSCGDVFLADVQLYNSAMNFLGNDLSKYCLGTAMAGVGLSTNLSSLKGVGWKPFAVGLSGALVVGGTGFTTAMLIA